MHIVSITWAKEGGNNESPYNRIHDAIFAIGQNTLGTDGQVRVNGGALAQQGFTLIGPVRDDVLGGRWVTKTFFQRFKGMQPCDLTAYEVRLPERNDISAQDFQSSILTVLREINKDDSVDAVVVAGSLIVDAVCDAIRNRREYFKDIRECNNRLQLIPLLMLYSFEPITDIDNAFFCWFPITTIARNAFDDIMKDCSHDFAQKSIGILMDDNPESVTASVFVKDAYSVFNGLMATRGKKVQAIYPESHDSDLLNDPEQRKKISLDIHKKLFACDIIFNVGVSPIVLDTLVEYAKNDKPTFIYSCNSILTKTSDLNDLSNFISHGVRFKFYDFVPDSLGGSLSLNSSNNSFFRFFYEVISIVLEKASSSRSSVGSLLEKLRQMRYFTAKNNDIFSFSQTRQLIVPTTQLQYTSDGLKEVGGGGLKKSLVSLDSIADLLRYIDREPISVSTADIEDIENGKAVSRIQEYAKKIEGQFSPSQVTLFLNNTTGGDNIKTLASCDERVSVVQRRLLKVLVDKCVYEPVQLSHETDTLENNGASQFFAIKHDGVLPLNYWQHAASNNAEDHGSEYHFFVSKSYADAWSTRKEMNDSDFLDAGCDAFDPKLFLDVQDVFSKGDQEEFWKYCYFIPSVIRGGQGKDVVLGWIVMRTAERLSYFEVKLLLIWADRFFESIVAKLHEHSIQLANVKSAIGSIMSRNGSHNIGSHVLAALSHNVGTMPDDRVLYQYIQHRMDYIATATTDFPNWTYSTKFVGGLIREFLSQRHLLEYISKSEGLQAFKFQDPNHIGDDRFNQENTIRLHVRRVGYGLPEGEKEVQFIEYSKTEDDLRQRFQHDIDVALPGGVIGGHAFFTILENVIRNAAKHGWAIKKAAERKEENLDVYIDFELDADCRNATVKVHDGMSDVFALVDEENVDDVGRKSIQELKNWIETNRQILYRSLDKDSLKQLKDYIEGKGENLPIPYGGLVDVLNGSVSCGNGKEGGGKRTWVAIKDKLTGKTDSDKELGHRLWLPLHHSQQIKLATPFIDDAGSLRRENWGLAEMKISAGYLQMRTISEIGGLDCDVNGYDGVKKIITPICVEHDSLGKDGKKETHHHLGYEFKIRCPRELLFVVQGEKPSGDSAKVAEQILFRHGVHIRYIDDSGYDAVFALQNNPSRLEWDFRYVMLPVFPQVSNPKLPFRVLTGKKSYKCCVPYFKEYFDYCRRLESVLAGETNAENWVHDLKKAVYKTWLDYWQSDRRKDIGKPVLSLVVDPSGGSDDGAGKKGGECLISDNDLWSVVLGNLFRTLVRQHLSLPFGHELEYRMKCYLVRIAVSDTREMLSDFDVSRPRYSLGRQMAAWFEKSNFGNISKDEILKKAEILKPLAEDFMVAGNAIPRQECDKILGKIADGDYAAEIQQFHSSLKEWLRKCKNAKSSSEHDFEAPQVEVNGKSYNYPGFQKFMDSCLVAFEHSAVFLRKYEERIATLPESFQVKASGGDGTFFVNATAQIGVDAVTGGSIPKSRKAIRYERHFDAGAFDRNTMAYAEPLSGTQTYLNMLGQLVGNNDCPIETVYSVSVSLMENALTRILIIDERTADFLKKHELSKQTYAHMGVWVLDDKTVEGCTPPRKSPDNKEWNPNVEQALLSASDIGVRIFTDMANCDDGDGEERRRWRKFDIVVIHQGLIDKWLSASAHDAKGVESLLERLKERVPYVVITTGRGTPSNTPATARILPFSVIEKTMFRQSPEKMILVDTVMNILPVGERK